MKAKQCTVRVMFHIQTSTIDIELTAEQALALYQQLLVALFTAPVVGRGEEEEGDVEEEEER